MQTYIKEDSREEKMRKKYFTFYSPKREKGKNRKKCINDPEKNITFE